ncbi:hypothetical protein [Bartonella koehlerae]|nr:hypothetical protein [Bartonella koehlerae]
MTSAKGIMVKPLCIASFTLMKTQAGTGHSLCQLKMLRQLLH